MSIQHSRSYQLAFSLNKQTDISTPVADAAIKYMRAVRAFNPSTETRPAQVGDREWYGKGHPFASFFDPIQKLYSLPATDRSATSLDLLFAAAYVLGSVVTTQPGTATGPNEYQHVITWQDIAQFKEVLYTTFLEKMGSEYEVALSGAYVSQFTLTGNRNDHVILNMESFAKKSATSTAELPAAVSASAFLKTLYGTVKFGPAGNLTLKSDQVLSYTLTFNQNPQPYFLMGNAAGEEMLVSKVLIGPQTVGGTITIFVDATARGYFQNSTRVGFELNLISPDVVDLNKHSCKIELPNCIVMSETFSEDGSTVAYQLGVNEEGVLKYGADPPVRLTFLNNISSSELLVVA